MFEASDTAQTSDSGHQSPMAQASMWFTNRTLFSHQCDLGIAHGPGMHIFRASDGSSYQTWLGHRIWPRHLYVSGIAHGSGSGCITAGMDVASDMAQASTHRHPCVPGIGSVQVSDTVRASHMPQVSTQFKHQTRFRHRMLSGHRNGPHIQIILASQMVQAPAFSQTLHMAQASMLFRHQISFKRRMCLVA